MSSGMTADAATDPLTELLVDLERDGDVRAAWLARHASDGSLDDVWAATTDPLSLVLAAMRAQGATSTALAICAAARAELPSVPACPLTKRLKVAITVAEMCVRDRTLPDALSAALVWLEPRQVWSDDVHRLGLGVGILVHFVLDVDAGEVTPAAAVAALVDSYDGPLVIDAAKSMLPSLRKTLPCPTLAQLRKAYRRT